MTESDAPPGDFATALAAAIENRQVALSWVRDRLGERGTPVSLAALSYWRSGQREPDRQVSLEAVAELESLLDLEVGELSSRLRGRDRSTGPVPFESLLLEEVTVSGERGETGVDRVLMHQIVDVGVDRRITGRRATQLYVAQVDDVEAVTLFFGPGDVHGSALDHILSTSGCRVAGSRVLESGTEAVRLEFDRPLASGESVVTEVEIDGDWTPEPVREVGNVAEQKYEECMVWVRFHPDALPSRVFVSFTEGELEHEWEVELNGASAVHHRQTGFGPGLCLVRWEW